MAPRYAVSDSDSGDERPLPSTAKMEKALRDAVAGVFRARNMDELTVKRMRMAAEKTLGLEEGFFKRDAEWKGESERIIKDEVETQDRATQGELEDEKYQEDNHHEEKQEDSPPERSSPAKENPATPTKRANEENVSKARKRRKTSSPESEGAQSEDSEEEVKKPVKKQPKTKSEKNEQRTLSEDRVSDESGSEEEVEKPVKKSKAKPKAAKPGDNSDAAKDESKPSEDANVDKDGSESELSEVIDEEPPKPKPKQQKSSESQPKPKKKGKDADLDPDQAEIKRLQGWLIKCGIRKMWARELAPYDTPKAKIKHLKQMLSDAGMTGRYSLEKAKRIREERELKADLEMVQEGAKLWGRGNEEEASDGERPRRRLARGRKSLAFLEIEGEEESE